MALVLYNPDQPKTSTQDEHESIEEKLKQLMLEIRERPYLGLSNQGATCYMNSLLQSLYMNCEVRNQIYQYKPVAGKNEVYDIPLQLQKLFAKLQLSKIGPVQTTDLTKSFHWTQSQSFEQQDVQEFCRVLFDAIDVSIAQTTGVQDAVSSLFQGTSESYVRCLNCGYESSTQTTFLDLNLPIRNEFGTGVLNSSLEMALENYIKPELLNGDNKYFCCRCNSKQDAEKGIKLTKGPQILSVVLNRFTLDYNTFQRVKLHERVSFPISIDLGNYLNGYDGIACKKYEQEVLLMNQFQKSKVEKSLKEELQKEEKIKTQQVQNQPKKKENEIFIKVSTEQEPTKQEIEVQHGSFDEATYHDYLTNTSGPRTFVVNPVTEYDSDEDFYTCLTLQLQEEIKKEGETFVDFSDNHQYRIKHKNEKFALVRPSQMSQKTEGDELEEALKQIRQMEEQEQLNHTQQASSESYDLFAILVHQGGAFGGHYFAYIKSFQDGQWYNFNDSNVTPINQSEIANTFGGSNGTNTAYMLMYQRTLTKINLVQQIPQQVQDFIQGETEKLIKEQLILQERALQLTLKIWHNHTQKTLQAKKNWKFCELKQKCNTAFQLKSSWRFRVYDSALQVRKQIINLDDQDKLSACELLKYPLDIEMGPDYEHYDEAVVYLKAYVWEADQDYDLTDLKEYALIKASNDLPTIEFERSVAVATGIPLENLTILLRHEQVNGNARVEFFNMQWRQQKLLKECSKFEHGQHIFVENNPKTTKFEDLNWKKEFNKQIDKVILMCNNPNDVDDFQYSLKITVYKNDTISQVKQIISSRTGLPVDSFYLMKQANQQEIKEINKTVSALYLTTGSKIQIERGKPLNEGKYKISIFEVQLTDQEPDSQIFTKELVGQILIKTDDTGAQLRQAAFELYQVKHGGRQLKFENFRIRNPMNDIGTVIKDFDFMDSIYLYDGKEIYMHIDQPEKFVAWDGKADEFSYILVRDWNVKTWQLGPIKEVQIPKNLKTHDFGLLLNRLYPHMQHMFGCRLGITRGFSRSDLFLKKWFQITTSGTGNVPLGLSQNFEITRDGIVIVIKDNSIERDDSHLTAEQKLLWCSQQYLDHMKRKQNGFTTQHKDHDSLLAATQNRQVDWSRPVRQEQGVKITVSDQHIQDQEQTKNATEEPIEFEPFF